MSLLLEKKLPVGFFLIYDEKPNFPCRGIKQVHGKEIAVVIDKNQYTEDKEADGLMMVLMNDMPVLSVQTADCMPIVVLGKRGVALLHAGWRGLQQEIALQKNVEVLMPYYFFIGPHINCCCFEVKEDFKKNFPNSPHFSQRDEKLYFSLIDEIKDQIKKVYPDAEIESSAICTCCDQTFHSFRRNGTNKRNWNLLLC